MYVIFSHSHTLTHAHTHTRRKHSDTGETAPTTRFRPGEGHMSKKMKLDLSRVKRSKQAKVPQVETGVTTKQ